MPAKKASQTLSKSDWHKILRSDRTAFHINHLFPSLYEVVSRETSASVMASQNSTFGVRVDFSSTSTLDEFWNKFTRLWSRELTIAWRFSPEFDELCQAVHNLYDRLEEDRCSKSEHRRIWQDDVEFFFKWVTEQKRREYTPWSAKEADRNKPLSLAWQTTEKLQEHKMYPLAIAMALYEPPNDIPLDRIHPWKTTLENWTHFQRRYKENPDFRYSLSLSQDASFQILKDWWNSHYSPRADMEEFRRKLDDLVSSVRLLTEDTLTKFAWTSHSLYHSTCVELFFREFHPSLFEINARREPLWCLARIRANSIKIALKQRFAYDTFTADTQRQAGPTQRVIDYPKIVRTYDSWGNNLLFTEILFQIGVIREGLEGIRQAFWPRPCYLWDVVRRKTIEVRDLPECPQYTCISHTWGRWRLRDCRNIHIPGVPWTVPPNSLYDVRKLPGILGRLSCEFIWLDLFCIHQDGSEAAKDEIGIQSSIFKRSKKCIAWLHDVDKWEGVKAALSFVGLSYLRHNNNDDELRVSDESLQLACNAANSPVELVKSGLANFSTWFSSLWTLQEAVLCPDIQLCSKNMEIFDDTHGCPISLTTLCLLLEDFDSTIEPGIPLSSPVPTPSLILEPSGVKQLIFLNRATRLGYLLSCLTPLEVMVQSNVRECTDSRAPAIMSAFDVTEWYEDAPPRGSDEEKAQLVLGTFPIAFVQEVVKAFGAVFYFAWSRADGMQPSEAEGVMELQASVGSMLPFTEPKGWMTVPVRSIKTYPLSPSNHAAVSGWEIRLDASVAIRSAGILASSTDGMELDFIEAAVFDGRKGAPVLNETNGLRADLRTMAGKHSVCYAVSLFEDYGVQHGIVLQGPQGRPPGNERLIKIGLFFTTFPVANPPSSPVDWVVL